GKKTVARVLHTQLPQRQSKFAKDAFNQRQHRRILRILGLEMQTGRRERQLRGLEAGGKFGGQSVEKRGRAELQSNIGQLLRRRFLTQVTRQHPVPQSALKRRQVEAAEIDLEARKGPAV